MRTTLLLLPLLAAGLLSAATAAASAPEPVSGTFVAPPPAPSSLKPAGENCIAEIPDVFQLDGALEGDLALDFRIVFHGPCSAFPAFPANFHASGTFSGTVTVDGVAREGTFDFTFNGIIDEHAQATGTLVVKQGGGGLAGLHGVLELTGIPGVGGTYAGSVHVDP